MINHIIEIISKLAGQLRERAKVLLQTYLRTVEVRKNVDTAPIPKGIRAIRGEALPVCLLYLNLTRKG